MDLSIITGAGSVISSVLDYTKWIKALLNTSGPISKAGYKALLTSRSILEKDDGPSPFAGPETYSLGWFTGTYQGYEFFRHSGGMEAFGAEVIFFPELKYGVVSLGNTASTSNAVETRLMGQLVADKIGVPEEKRFDWNKKYGILLITCGFC
jgi:CubicO group peptidase (beta-lactamase class C family)